MREMDCQHSPYGISHQWHGRITKTLKKMKKEEMHPTISCAKTW